MDAIMRHLAANKHCANLQYAVYFDIERWMGRRVLGRACGYIDIDI